MSVVIIQSAISNEFEKSKYYSTKGCDPMFKFIHENFIF
jgi:hypothetical protein